MRSFRDRHRYPAGQLAARRGGPYAPFYPGDLTGLRAWYDAELGQPKNVGYVQLDGASGDYIFTPDSAALSFSNDIEVVMRVRVTDWTAASNQTLCGKYVTTTNQRSWRFYVSTTGNIGLTASTNGTAVTSVLVTPTVALTGNAWVWLRLRLDLSNGSNSVGTVETAADAGTNIEPSSWTANGTNTGVIISGVFDSSAPLEIGSFANGASERLYGDVGRCIVRSGFGGTVVADFNADDCYGDGYTHTDGYRWTLGLPKIYDRSGNNHPPAVFGSGSNQPKWLPWDGTPSVYLPGGTSNYVSCPDSVGVSVTGDITLTAQVTLTDWQSSTYRSVLSKYGTQTSWLVQIGSGFIRVYFNAGAGPTNRDLAHGIEGSGTWWIRVSRVQSTGVVSYEKSSDGVTWTSLGSHPTPVGAGSAINDSNTAVVLGKYGDGGGSSAGSDANQLIHHRALVQSGVPGGTLTTVADFNAELCGQSGHTDAQGNPWTVNRGTAGQKTVVQSPAARSARSVILHGTDDRFSVPAAALPTFGTSGVGAVAAVQRKWATLGTNDRVFDSKASNSATAAGLYVGSGGTAADLVANAGDGTNQANSTVASGAVSGVRQVVGLTVSATQVQAFSNNTFATAASRPVGSMDSGGDLMVMANSTGVEYSDGTVEAVIVRGAEMSAVEQALLVAYYGGGL